jgi:HEAT repeat protein
MSDTDITICIKLLNERPKWFFQKENIAEKLQCFDTIQEHGTPHTIYFLINFLGSDNNLIQARAAETILYLFTKLKSLNEYTDALKHLPIEKSHLDFYRIDFDVKTYVQLLGIASLNGNGYVREKALKELSRLKNADGLKFILLRLGDWVEVVRKAAINAVSVFLEEAYINDWLKQLSMLDWLLEVGRVDLSEIHGRIIQFIVTRELSEDFCNTINRLDDKIRLRFYKSFLINKDITGQQINRIAADRNFLVRAELLNHLSVSQHDLLKMFIEKFLQDKSVAVRVKALYGSKAFAPEFDKQIAYLLSDESNSVRELSRHLLKEKGIDFAQLYRQRIADKQFILGSLLGLCETGTQEDFPTFEQNIHAKKKQTGCCIINCSQQV